LSSPAYEADTKVFLNQRNSMETTILNAALASVGAPPLSRETLRSVEQSESEKNSNARASATPTLCLGLPSESAEFRGRLFRLDETHHPKVTSLAKAGERFVRKIAHNDFRTGRRLILSGPPGTGKTKVAWAIYRYVKAFSADIAWNHGGKHFEKKWIDWPDVAETDKESDFEDLCQEIGESEFIVLDDVGSETDRFKSGLPASRLRRVLSRTEKKWIIVTTNLPKAELLNLYDARVADRFKVFKWLSLDGVPSYRSKL